jgi:hypothetical protein
MDSRVDMSGSPLGVLRQTLIDLGYLCETKFKNIQQK